MFNWADIRIFLAVVEARTTMGAARLLGVSQPTVVRRMAALEAALGLELFTHQASGYVPTEAAYALAERAAEMRSSAERLLRLAEALRRQSTRVLRMTAPESMTSDIMVPAAARFRAVWPGVEVRLLGVDRVVDIAGGEADVAVRVGVRPTDPDLVARRVGRAAWAVYCASGFTRPPGGPGDLRGLPLVVPEGPAAAIPAFRWLLETAGEADVVWRSPNILQLVAGVRANLGLSIFPCSIGDGDPALVRCFGPIAEVSSDLWLVIRGALRHDPAARALLGCLGRELETQRSRYEGRMLGVNS